MAPKALGTLTKPEDVTLPPYYPPGLLEDRAQYLDCIRLCDKQVGEILQRLETEGILDQTFIIFMGDNGISHPQGWHRGRRLAEHDFISLGVERQVAPVSPMHR